MLDFKGDYASDTRPPRKGDGRGPWAKDPSTPLSDDGTRLDATFANDLVGMIRQLMSRFNPSAAAGDDEALANAILSAFEEKISALAIVDIGGSSALAPLDSPSFSGTPTAPNVSSGDSSLKIANTAFVAAAIAALTNSAPGALDTLKELADAIGDDANFAATVINALALKAPLDSPAFSGAPTVPNVAAGDNSTKAANTAYVANAVVAAIAAFVPTADQITAVRQPSAFRNLLVNPYGEINQRSLSSNANNTYGHDRWLALAQSGPIAVSTVSDAENGTPRMWRLTQSQASAQRMGYGQWIKGANCRYLRGKTVTLSGRVRFSLNAALRYAICEWTGAEDTLSTARDPVNSWNNASFTAGNFFKNTTFNILSVGTITPAAGALSDLAPLTATVGNGANNLFVMVWTEGTAAQNATLDGAIQLEAGSVASSREFRPSASEVRMCKEYFHQVGGGASTLYVTGNVGIASQGWNETLYFPVPMRIAPSGTRSGTWALVNCGQPLVFSTTRDFAVIQSIASAGGFLSFAADSADDLISFDAEL